MQSHSQSIHVRKSPGATSKVYVDPRGFFSCHIKNVKRWQKQSLIFQGTNVQRKSGENFAWWQNCCPANLSLIRYLITFNRCGKLKMLSETLYHCGLKFSLFSYWFWPSIFFSMICKEKKVWVTGSFIGKFECRSWWSNTQFLLDQMLFCPIKIRVHWATILWKEV